ncbi:hypothetical protein BH09ACT6_BH09ACT6_08350 [soil metagenome]
MTPQRNLRSDAAHNRHRILVSAERIFRESGPNASLDSIAVDAGVGNATLYRHFATRLELRHAVLTSRIAEVEEFLTELEARPEADAWADVEKYVRFLAASPDNTFVDVLVAAPAETDEIGRYRQRVRVRVENLLSRARASGVLRSGYSVDDMNVFLFAHTKAAFSPHIDRAAADRLLGDYLAGIRQIA